VTLLYLIFIFTLPFLVVLGPFYGLLGVGIAAGLGTSSLIFFHFVSEHRVRRMIRSKLNFTHNTDSDVHSKLLKKTLNEVLLGYADTLELKSRAGFLRNPPRIEILSSPGSTLWVFRSPMSNGTIVVSRGLLQTLDELTLRNLLFTSLQSLHASYTPWHTTCAYLLEVISGMGSKEFHELLWGKVQKKGNHSGLSQTDLTPLGVLAFVITFPIQKRLVKSLSSTKSRVTGIAASAQMHNGDPLFNVLNPLGNYE
jgi:hypothetical protein